MVVKVVVEVVVEVVEVVVEEEAEEQGKRDGPMAAAEEATASPHAAPAALRGAQERPEPLGATGRAHGVLRLGRSGRELIFGRAGAPGDRRAAGSR